MLSRSSVPPGAALLFACAALLGCTLHAAVIHVDDDARPGGDGSSWKLAYRDLQEALDAASAGDEIRVAEGTYRPTSGLDREATFQLKEGVALLGGYAPKTGQRDFTATPSILSGDIGERGEAEDNVYHVVTGVTGAVLDGFVVTGGYGAIEASEAPPRGAPPPPGRGAPGRTPPRNNRGNPGGPPGQGGGIHTTPEQIIAEPQAGTGAGMINFKAAPTVRNCVFEGNQAEKGGAVYNMTTTALPFPPRGSTPQPLFVRCTFRDNSAGKRGGAVANDLGTEPVFLSCVFENNRTDEKGGGMYNDFSCSPVLINCIFRGNSAESAGAMGNDGASSPVLSWCTFTQNRADEYGPSLYQGTGPSNDPVLLHCVVWGNSCTWEGVGLYNWHDCSPVVEETWIEGGYGDARTDDPEVNVLGVAEVDAGYKPGDLRFTETELTALLAALEPWRKSSKSPAPAPAEPPAIASGRVVYVNAAAAPGGNGSSWSTAYASLAEALPDAGVDGAAVWIAQGTYTPSDADRSISFELRAGVRLYGGFSGNETALSKRNPEKFPTILSGEIGDPKERSDNSCHVLIGAPDALLDGLTITRGYADGVAYDGKGGGLVGYGRGPQRAPQDGEPSGFSMTVTNCRFVENYAREGGAVYNYDRSEPTFTNCLFRKNEAENGGAVVDRVGVIAGYTGCTFEENTALWRAGAAYFDYGSRPTITDCTFEKNSAGAHGGAIFSASRASQLEATTVTIEGCTFSANTAKGNGGAICFHDSSEAAVSDTTFGKNKAGESGGAVAVTSQSNATFSNATYRGNRAKGSGNDLYEEPSSSGAPPRPR